jgi:hypothetical protein
MAYFGLRNPVIAKYNRSTGVYSNGFICGKAVSLEVNPNYSEGSLYGDDEQAEYEKAFINANVTLGTTTLPLAAAEVVFGHTVDSETNEVIKKTTDESEYVGVGVVIDEVVDGVKKYFALIITCAQFSEGAESFQTKGESITFGNPSIAGLAIGDINSQWQIKKPYDTATEALNFIKTTFGMSVSA